MTKELILSNISMQISIMNNSRTSSMMNPTYSSLNFNNYQLLADFVSSRFPPIPSSPTPMNYLETKSRHSCHCTDYILICLMSHLCCSFPPIAQRSIVSNMYSLSVTGGRQRARQICIWAKVDKEYDSSIELGAELRLSRSSQEFLKLLGGDEGKKVILDFLQEVRVHAGLCVCVCIFIIKMGDSKRLEDLGTARQLAFGL